jgi:predicted ATPase
MYPLSGFSSTSAGPSGANAASLLIAEKLLRPHRRPLRQQVCHWLKQLGLADDVSIEDIARGVNLYEMSLRSRRWKALENIADIGYGLSQVLPVIVEGLLVPRGGVYMVQQPELHLHPDAQAAMMDYFIYLAVAGVRVIVETHSEYMLLRLRRRLAEAGSQHPAGPSRFRLRLSREMVSVLRAVSTKDGAEVTELRIDEGFQFEDLPADFMSQSLDDRMRLLETVARSVRHSS